MIDELRCVKDRGAGRKAVFPGGLLLLTLDGARPGSWKEL
jgi:hypothetical protein